MASEPDHEPSDEGGAFLGTDSDISSIPGPYTPRRGPVLVSSDEESEPRLARPQLLRPLSKTPSWAKSSVSPRDTFRPIGGSEPGSDADSKSNSELGGEKKKRFGFVRSRSLTEHTSLRTSSSAGPVIGGSISRGSSRWGSVFEFDSERESNSGESGRIRYTRIGSEGNWGQRMLSPSGSGWGTVCSESEEFSLEEATPRPDQPSTGHGSTSPREVFGRNRHSKSRSSSYQYAESGSSVEPIAPHSSSKTLDSPSEGDDGEASDSGDNSGKEFKLKTSQRPGQSSSQRGLDCEGSQYSASGLDLTISSSGADTATHFKKFGGEKSPKTKKRTHHAKKPIRKLNPDYIRLLNEEIRLVASRGCEGNPVASASARQRGSRAIMGSVWTSYEKTAFFKYLSIVGKDNLPQLARGVGTKSIVECRAYLKALQDGKEDDFEFFYVQDHRGRDLFSAEDAPAAVELSDECVKALELDADHLEARTRRYEERKEKAKWGDSWLLNSTTAEHIEHLYRNKCIEEIRDIAPEAELLNLDGMLDIAGRYVYLPNPAYPILLQ